jgi:hypothetical protein
MKRGKKSKKKKPAAASVLTEEQDRHLRSLLKDLPEKDPAEIVASISDPRVAEALIEKLPLEDPQAVALIQALRANFSQKKVQKAIKTVVFKLKSKGVSVPAAETADKAPILTRPAQKETAVARLGPVDGHGNRGVFLALPHAYKGFEVGTGVVNNESGIGYFVAGGYSKKKMHEVLDLFAGHFEKLIDVSLGHAASVLEEAYNVSRDAPAEAVSEYLTLRPQLIEKIELPSSPPIYDQLKESEIADPLTSGSQMEKLFDHPLMRFWFMDREEIEPLGKEMAAVEDSPIVLSEAQETDRKQAMQKEWLTRQYPEWRRKALKNRLEEMAYFFLKTEEKDYALLAAAAARSLEAKSRLVQTDSVLHFMLERSLVAYSNVREEGNSDEIADNSPDLILP